jgi:hypothetical protein
LADSASGTIAGGISDGDATVAVYNAGRIVGTSADGVFLGATGEITNAASGTVSGAPRGVHAGATVVVYTCRQHRWRNGR